MKNMIDVSHLYYTYHSPKGELPVLNDLSFSLKEGDFLAILGPSGCGKSTLLNLLAGLLTPGSGTISFKGRPLQEISENYMGYMLQKDQLLEWRSIIKNVCLGLEIKKKQQSKALDPYTLLKKYGLEQFADAKPSQLSGGMRQRAALCRTLVRNPSVLFLDEPFSALDYQTRLQTGNEIGSIIQKEHKTAVLVTHDLAEAVSLSDKVLILTKRPARIKQILPMDFPKDLSPMERRNTPLFQTYFNQIWKELNDNDTIC